MPDAETVFIPEQDFDDFTGFVAKTKQVPGKRIKLELVHHNGAEPIDRFTHVRAAHGKIDLGVSRKQSHALPPRVWTTRARTSGLKFSVRVMAILPSWIFTPGSV